jgi:hypothetical protein
MAKTKTVRAPEDVREDLDALHAQSEGGASDTPTIEPTFDELANLADELGDPLHHSLVLLEMIRDSEVKNQCDVAAAVMALIEQADQRRERLLESLCRLTQSERTTDGSKEVQS